jgi:hypothetical protein
MRVGGGEWVEVGMLVKGNGRKRIWARDPAGFSSVDVNGIFPGSIDPCLQQIRVAKRVSRYEVANPE